MNKTPIEWVKNPDGSPGYTFNPITGCLNGCEYCYARKLANGRLKSRYLANTNIPDYLRRPESVKGWKGLGQAFGKVEDALNDPFYPRFWEDRFKKLERTTQGKPLGIFVCDMGELFGDWIPPEWRKKVFDVMAVNPQHRFYLLTKQPQNLQKFSPFPDNCWVGVTATGEIMFDDALMWLGQIQASVKYLSLEPYLERINPASLSQLLQWTGISQVIIGSQTKPYKPPEIEWVEEIVRACDKAGVKVFLKDNLMPLIVDQPRVPTWSSNRTGLRQEMPV